MRGPACCQAERNWWRGCRQRHAWQSAIGETPQATCTARRIAHTCSEGSQWSADDTHWTCLLYTSDAADDM
eukprot:7654674-Alexandrium_andersonii.AAC.1